MHRRMGLKYNKPLSNKTILKLREPESIALYCSSTVVLEPFASRCQRQRPHLNRTSVPNILVRSINDIKLKNEIQQVLERDKWNF